MKQSLKIGFVTLVVAAMAAGGLAFAQSDGTDDSVPPTDESRVEEIVPGGPELGHHWFGFEGRRGHHGMRGGPAHLGRVADILGVEADVIRDELEAGKTLADIAAANGSSGTALVEELVADLSERLDEAVAADRITQERAGQILADASAKITTLVDSTQEEIRAACEAERAEREAEREARRVERQETLSSVIGIPFEDIQAALQEGETTLAQIAAEGPNALSVDELVAGLVAPVAEDLQARVAEGTLTQAQADERLAEITARMTERVQAVPGDGRGFDGHHGRHGRRGPGFGDHGGFGGGFGGGPDPAPAEEVSLSA